MPRPFLTARWSHLLIVSFEVPEGLVHRVVPAALELDRWQGCAHLSLVALRMDDVRVRGWRVPGLPAHFQERYLGYRVDRRGRLTIFRVEHPSWVGREVRRLEWVGRPQRAAPRLSDLCGRL